MLGELYNVSFKQIRNRANRFDRDDPSGLLNKPHSGRPRKLTEYHLYKLQSVLPESPERQGYNTANLSAPLVQDFIYKQYYIEYKFFNSYRLMYFLGFSYQKARGFFPERN